MSEIQQTLPLAVPHVRPLLVQELDVAEHLLARITAIVDEERAGTSQWDAFADDVLDAVEDVLAMDYWLPGSYHETAGRVLRLVRKHDYYSSQARAGVQLARLLEALAAATAHITERMQAEHQQSLAA